MERLPQGDVLAALRVYPQLMGIVPKNAGGLWFTAGSGRRLGDFGAGAYPDEAVLAERLGGGGGGEIQGI